MVRRIREIIDKKGLEYYDEIIAWRERRGEVSDPTSELAVNRAKVERSKLSGPPPWTTGEICGNEATSTTAPTSLTEPAAEPGLPG